MKDLTKGTPLKLIIGFAVSLLAANMLGQLYAFVDSIMVGRLVSSNAIGAISATNPLIGVVTTLNGGIANGFGIVLGRYFGASDTGKLRRAMANALYLTGVISGLSVAILLSSMNRLLIWSNTPAELVDMAGQYARIIILSQPVSLFGGVLGVAFRSLGDSKTPLFTSMAGGAMNVCYNFLFIAVFRCGIAGAAYGTACSCATNLLLNACFFRARLPMLRITRADAGVDLREMRRLLFTGLPIGLQSSITNIGMIILQSAVNRHGAAAVTGIATGEKIVGLIWTIILTMETSLIFYTAQNRGAGNYPRIRQGVRQIALLTFGMVALLTLGVFLGGKYLFMPFVGNDAELLDIAATFARMQLCFFPFMVLLCVLRGAVQGMGYTFSTVICGCIELGSRILIIGFAQNLETLILASPAAWILTTAFLAVLYPVLLRRLKKKLTGSHTEPTPAAPSPAAP